MTVYSALQILNQVKRLSLLNISRWSNSWIICMLTWLRNRCSCFHENLLISWTTVSTPRSLCKSLFLTCRWGLTLYNFNVARTGIPPQLDPINPNWFVHLLGKNWFEAIKKKPIDFFSYSVPHVFMICSFRMKSIRLVPSSFLPRYFAVFPYGTVHTDEWFKTIGTCSVLLLVRFEIV